MTMKSVDEIPKEELGIARDITVDELIEVRGAQHRLETMAVDLDSLVDSDYVCRVMGDRLWESRMEFLEYKDILESHEAILSSRRDAIMDRIQEEYHE